MRKIHMDISQGDQVNHGLFTLFTRAKEIYKMSWCMKEVVYI